MLKAQRRTRQAGWFTGCRPSLPVLAFCAFSLVPVSTSHAQGVEAQYLISLAGLNLGRATLSGTLGEEAYSLNVSARLTGLVGAVTSGQGGASARGTIGKQPLSNGFALSASNGSTTRTVQISASAGSVKGVVIEPPFEPNPERVPVKPQHLVNIVDPVSALLMPVLGANAKDKANCNRKIPVFDGTQRFDVVLSFVETQQIEHESGYKGAILICSARYVPQAGHRPERRVTKFMMENKDMSVWLVPAQKGEVLLPLRISVKTMIGTSVIEATSFSAP
jgi:hypothetical protein